jgi:hypothetical protein
VNSFSLLAMQEGAESASALGTMEIVFLTLWGVFTLAYFTQYKRDENIVTAALKCAGLLGFVYLVISGFDWLQADVVAADRIPMFWEDEFLVDGPRVPFLEYAFPIFVGVLLLLVAWYARHKFETVVGVVLSAWDRGHWYMLPVLFILMTVGLLLVAAAASPVLSPFIYTLF